MLVLDGLLVALSTLLLELDFHGALGVLDDGGLHLDLGGRDDGVAADGVFAGAELVNFVELEDVSDLDVAQMGHGEEVAGRQDVFLADEGRDDVARGLGADEFERGCGCAGCCCVYTACSKGQGC